MLKSYFLKFLVIQLFVLLTYGKVFSQAPANDLKQNAISIGATTNCNAYSYQGSYNSYDLTNATGTGSTKDVWFKFVASSTDYELSYIYTSYVGFDVTSDDAGAYATKNGNIFHVSKAGATYYIRFYNLGTSNLSGVFCFYPSVANDDKSTATPITDGACISNGFAFRNATQSSQAFTCNSDTDYSDIWYSFIPTSTAYHITANTQSAITFYVQVTNQSDSVIACGSGIMNSGKATADLSITNLIPGNKYYIRITKYDNNADISMKVCLIPQAGLPYMKFNPIAKTFGDAPFTVLSTSNSPAAITYSIASGSQYATITPDGNVIILGAGTVTIQANQAATPGYLAGSITTTLSINKATLTMKADDQVKIYNTDNPPLTYTYTGLMNGDIPGVQFTEPNINTIVVTSTIPGTYPITFSGGSSDNYSFNFINGAFIVNKLIPTLTYTGPTTGKVNAGIIPTATSNSDGVISYNVTSGTGAAHISGNKLIGDKTGTVTLSINIAASILYQAASITQVISLNPPDVSPTVSFSIPDKTINDSPFMLTAISNSPGKITYSLEMGGADITPEGLVTILTRGTVYVQGHQDAAPGYLATDFYADFYIDLPAPTLIYTGDTLGYVGNVIPLTVTTNSDGKVTYYITNLTGGATLSGSNLTLNFAGTVKLTIAVETSTNYTSKVITQTITINNKVNPTLTFTNSNKTYGDAPFSVVLSNSPGDITYQILNGSQYVTLDNATGIANITGVGNATIKVTQAPSGQYNGTVQILNLSIYKKSLFIIAENKTKPYNTDNPELTVIYSGFAYNENESVLTTLPVLTTNATKTSVVQTYQISVTSASSPNYSISYGYGTLTVTKATPEFIYTGETSGTVGSTISISVSKNSNGILTFTTGSGTGSGTVSGLTPNFTLVLTQAGTFLLLINLSGDGNYTYANLNIPITVFPAAVDPVLSLSDITKTYGDENSTIAAATNSPGEITYSITSGNEFASITPSGELTIIGAGIVTIKADQAAATGYKAKSATATLTIEKTNPTLSYTGSTSGNERETITLNSSSNSTGSISYTLLSVGTGMATLTNDQLELNFRGSLSVEIKVEADNNYNSKTITQEITISGETAVQYGNLNNISIDVYPNPATDYVTVNLEKAGVENGKLALYDLEGKMIYLIAEGYLGAKKYSIPMEGLTGGLYMIKLETPEGTLIRKVTK